MPNRWTVRRILTIHAILKNYIKYMQHGTSLNKNKVNSGRYLKLLVRLLSKGKLKIKSSGFSLVLFRLLQLIVQSIFVRF